MCGDHPEQICYNPHLNPWRGQLRLLLHLRTRVYLPNHHLPNRKSPCQTRPPFFTYPVRRGCDLDGLNKFFDRNTIAFFIVNQTLPIDIGDMFLPALSRKPYRLPLLLDSPIRIFRKSPGDITLSLEGSWVLGVIRRARAFKDGYIGMDLLRKLRSGSLHQRTISY